MHCKQTHNFYKRIVSRIMYFQNVMTVYSCSFCSKKFFYVKPFNFVIIKHFEIKQLYNSKFSTNERGCVWSYEFYDPIWTRYAFIKTIIPFLQVFVWADEFPSFIILLRKDFISNVLFYCMFF